MPRGIVGTLGTHYDVGFGKRWGPKERGKRKACHGDSKKEKKSVCACDPVGRGREGVGRETTVGDI